jgi:hypothetical protein
MTQHRVPLVGSYYRPPAAALVKRLPVDAPLRIIPEPDNPHDGNALAVHLATADYPFWTQRGLLDAEFEKELAGFGMSLEGVYNAESFHLGYIGRADAARLAPEVALVLPACPMPFLRASLGFDPAGKPQVVFELT